MADPKQPFFKVLFTREMLIMLGLGFSSGLPLLLVGKTLQTWMTVEGVNLKTVGFMIWASLPLGFKFIWAPIMDRFSIPYFGRRRGWLLISQILLFILIAGFSIFNPGAQLEQIALLAVVTSFVSASQDIVADAYRRDILPDSVIAIGTSIFIYGYRIAMWIAGGLSLILVGHIGWPTVYLLMSLLMIVGIVTTLFAKEPASSSRAPRNFKETVVDPFVDFFSTKGAIVSIVFVLFYKIGDSISGNMLNPFYVKMGYDLKEIGLIAKSVTLPFTLVAGLVGAAIVYKVGINRSLWIFGILQALSTLAFTLLLTAGKSLIALGVVIVFEDVSSALGSAAFVAFMASMTNRRFSATQYAFLTSVMAWAQRLVPGMAGVMQEAVGWNAFFVICALCALPGLFLIPRLSSAQRVQ